MVCHQKWVHVKHSPLTAWLMFVGLAAPVQALTYVNNFFWGERYMDHGGPFHVTCLSTGDSMQGSINRTLFRGSTKQVCCWVLLVNSHC